MSSERTVTTVDVTTGTILKFFGLAVLIIALWSVRSVVTVALFSIVFASAMTPFVNALHQLGIPRWLGIALVYVVFLGVLTVIIVLFGQLVSDQVRELSEKFPSFYNRAVEFLFGSEAADQRFAETIQGWLQSVTNQLVKISGQLAAGTISVFGGFFTFIGILVLTFYMVSEVDGFKRFMNAVSPAQYLPYLHQLVDRVQQRLGGWVRGQLLLSAIIASLSFIGLLLLGVDYALSLALIAGVSELIPIVGPIIGAVPAIFVAFGQSPLLAALVALLYLMIQQLENNLIVPKVMQRTTGLNPVVTIVIVLVGAKLAGFAGVILALPIALIIDTFFEDFFREGEEAAPDEAETSDV